MRAGHLACRSERCAPPGSLDSNVSRYMRQCLSCGKNLSRFTRKCDRCGAVVPDTSSPHCGKSHPSGTPFYAEPAIIVAWLLCSAEGYWLMHSYAKLPDWLSIPVAPLGVAFLFYFLWWIGD